MKAQNGKARPYFLGKIKASYKLFYKNNPEGKN
jgi:hypothetical protein